MATIRAFTEDGKMSDMSEGELETGLIHYAPTILSAWGKDAPQDRFLVNPADDDQMFMLVTPEEMVRLVMLALKVAPSLIEQVYRDKITAEYATGDRDTPSKKCGG